MGLFDYEPWHGNYEITFLGSTGYSLNENDKKTMVIEADNNIDARKQAEKQIKSYGYKSFKILSIKCLKYTSGSRAAKERKEKELQKEKWKISSYNTSSSNYEEVSYNTSSNIKGSSTLSKKGKIVLAVISIILGICLSIGLIKCVENTKIAAGTYYLYAITGTTTTQADKTKNYITLENGTCTVHIVLQTPTKNEVITCKYTGTKYDDIRFENDRINMEGKGKISFKYYFDDYHYNTFDYKIKK